MNEFLLALLSGIFTTALLAGLIKTFGNEYIKAQIKSIFEDAKFKKQLIGTAELDYRQKQLEEFYGPFFTITAYLNNLHLIFAKLPPDHPNRAEINKVILQHIEKLEWLIINKTHLIEGATIPENFAEYAAHARNAYITLSLSSPANVPLPINDFGKKEIQTTQNIKKRLHELYLQYAITEKLDTGNTD